MEGEGPPFGGVSFPLQTSLISLNFPARQPPDWVVKIFCVFRTAVAVQGSFCRFGRCEGFAEYGFAPDLWVGCVGRVYAFRKCRLIPPSSVAYATNCLQFSSPPQGEAFCTLSEHGKYGFALWFAFAIRHHKNVTFSRHGTTHGSFRLPFLN